MQCSAPMVCSAVSGVDCRVGEVYDGEPVVCATLPLWLFRSSGVRAAFLLIRSVDPPPLRPSGAVPTPGPRCR